MKFNIEVEVVKGPLYDGVIVRIGNTHSRVKRVRREQYVEERWGRLHLTKEYIRSMVQEAVDIGTRQ